MAFQLPSTTAQVVLLAQTLPMGDALAVFFQAFGGALAINIGQITLSKVLIQQLFTLPQVDAASVIADGATNIVTGKPPALQGLVKAVYSFALSWTYILRIAGGGTERDCHEAQKKSERKALKVPATSKWGPHPVSQSYAEPRP